MKRQEQQQKKNRFFFSKLEPFTNSTFNIPVGKEEKLPATPPTLFVTPLKGKSDGDCFSSVSSDNNFLPSERLTRIYYEPTKYSLVAQ